MALADNDLLIVQKPATKIHYKIKVSDLPSGEELPEGNNVGDTLSWTGGEWQATGTIDGGTF